MTTVPVPGMRSTISDGSDGLRAIPKEYDLTSVKNIQTVRIGAGVDDAEARILVHRIVERHPGGAAGN